jgi:uncharacterized membrane protein
MLYWADPNGKEITNLGTLGRDYSNALGINDAGQVVGHPRPKTGRPMTLLLAANGVGIINLNSLRDLPNPHCQLRNKVREAAGARIPF